MAEEAGVSKRERIAEIAAAHHVRISPVGGRYDVCHRCGHMWPCDTALVAARLGELEGLVRIALGVRGEADVYRKWERILEHRVKGASGSVYHHRDQECRLCELLAFAVRIEDEEEQR